MPWETQGIFLLRLLKVFLKNTTDIPLGLSAKAIEFLKLVLFSVNHLF